MSENIQRYRFLKGILPSPQKRQLVILTGARQTGKTTLARHKYPGLNYINLDSPENRESLRAVSSAAWAKTIGNAVIDEAQKEPVVFEKVKYAYDEKSISFSVMLGSSQILLLKKIRESLAGRAAIYELWPLMMSELYWGADSRNVEPPLVDRLFSGMSFDRAFKGIPEVLIDKTEAKYGEAESHLLKWGGMPALLPLSNEERGKWLRDYQYTYLERDLGDLARLDDLMPFRTFEKLSALRSGKLLNYSELARDAGVGVDTARRYLEYLRLSYQAVLLPPYHRNVTSSVIKTPKLYWLDVGLLRQLTGMKEGLSGEIYETMVVGELLKWLKTAQRSSEIYFYRTRSGLEVDIILQTENGIVGMEIKTRKTIASRDTRPLKEVARGFGKEWRGGMLVYQGNEVKKIDDPNIWAVPSRRLFI